MEIHQYDENLIIVMNIDQGNGNVSLWWKFINMMKLMKGCEETKLQNQFILHSTSSFHAKQTLQTFVCNLHIPLV